MGLGLKEKSKRCLIQCTKCLELKYLCLLWIRWIEAMEQVPGLIIPGLVHLINKTEQKGNQGYFKKTYCFQMVTMICFVSLWIDNV